MFPELPNSSYRWPRVLNLPVAPYLVITCAFYNQSVPQPISEFESITGADGR